MATSGRTYNRPIHGQKEVCGLTRANSQSLWVAQEGVFVQPTEKDAPKDQHEELWEDSVGIKIPVISGLLLTSLK